VKHLAGPGHCYPNKAFLPVTGMLLSDEKMVHGSAHGRFRMALDFLPRSAGAVGSLVRRRDRGPQIDRRSRGLRGPLGGPRTACGIGQGPCSASVRCPEHENPAPPKKAPDRIGAAGAFCVLKRSGTFSEDYLINVAASRVASKIPTDTVWYY